MTTFHMKTKKLVGKAFRIGSMALLVYAGIVCVKKFEVHSKRIPIAFLQYSKSFSLFSKSSSKVRSASICAIT